MSEGIEKHLIVLGAGGHGRVCTEAAQAAGFRVRAFCDDAMDSGTLVNGIEVVGSISYAFQVFSPADSAIVVAIGDNGARMKWLSEAQRYGFTTPAIIHPSAVISPTATIDPGSVVFANSVVNANARIGRGCILNTACSIDHDNWLEDGVQICPGVRAAGNVRFGEMAFVGTGAIVIPGVKVGTDAYIAAGTVVVDDVEDGAWVSHRTNDR